MRNQLLAFSKPGDVVLDPFCGRGTTVLESLLNDRNSLGCDINPVAACIAGAKADVPKLKDVCFRLDGLQAEFKDSAVTEGERNEFFQLCFHAGTAAQLFFLKGKLNWQTNEVDRFIAALVLGALHGESHRTTLCLGNRMPRTISTKPDYSIRWWRERGLLPPNRDTFSVVRQLAEYRFSDLIPKLRGEVILCDARLASDRLSRHRGSVSLVITSPPYLDTTDYAEDQWLRLWFLGGPSRPTARLNRDDRHTRVEEYWKFMGESWRGIEKLSRA